MKPDIARILELNDQAAKKALGNFYRVSDAHADHLAGVMLDRLDTLWVLRTNTKEADGILDPLTQKIITDFAPQAILVKNSHQSRQQKGLELTDAVLYGGIETSEIQVPENLFFYRYDINGSELFSFELVSLRKKLAESLPHDAVILGCGVDDLLPMGHILTNQYVMSGESFSEQTDFLRRENMLLNTAPTAAIIVMRQRFFTKHQKSVFHLYYQLAKMLEQTSIVYLCARQPKPYADMMKMAAKKCGKDVKVVMCLMG